MSRSSAMQKLDSEQLAGAAQKSFSLARDGRLTAAQQSNMLTQGMRLRAALISALSAEFTTSLKQVDDANRQLTELNRQLADTDAAISQIATTLKQVAVIAALIEKLLTKAVPFL